MVTEPSESIDDSFNEFRAGKVSPNKPFEGHLAVKEALAHLSYKSSALIDESKLLIVIKYELTDLLFSNRCQSLWCEKVRVTIKDFLEVTRHVLILKLAGWVVGPEAKVHGISDEDVGGESL